MSIIHNNASISVESGGLSGGGRDPGEKEFGQRTFLGESCPTWRTPVLEETGSLPLHVVSERGKQVHPKGVSKQTGFFHLMEMT